MQLMSHDVSFYRIHIFFIIFIKIKDQTVRYNALIAVQKMMVNNWEILGRQISVN